MVRETTGRGRKTRKRINRETKQQDIRGWGGSVGTADCDLNEYPPFQKVENEASSKGHLPEIVENPQEVPPMKLKVERGTHC